MFYAPILYVLAPLFQSVICLDSFIFVDLMEFIRTYQYFQYWIDGFVYAHIYTLSNSLYGRQLCVKRKPTKKRV